MRIVFLGTFGLRPKQTIPARAIPLARALMQRGHEVNVVLPPWDCPEMAGQRQVVESVPVNNVPLPRWPLSLGIPALVARLVQEVQRFQPDVVHGFKPIAFTALSLGWLRWRRGRRSSPRLVVDTDDWEGPGGWQDRRGRPSRLAGSTSSPLAFLMGWQERRLLRSADAITIASRYLGERVGALRQGDTGVHYLPNGASPWAADPGDGATVRARHALGEAPVVLLYTRFVEFAPTFVRQVFASVARSLPGSRLVVVGTGLGGEEEMLRTEIAATGLTERATFAGWVPREALPDYLAAADVALFPMDDTVVNRAKNSARLTDLLSAGVAVVASAIGENTAYIEDGVSGTLVPPGDPEAMARAVTALLADEPSRLRLGESARRRMETEFSWDALALRAEEAYQGGGQT